MSKAIEAYISQDTVLEQALYDISNDYLKSIQDAADRRDKKTDEIRAAREQLRLDLEKALAEELLAEQNKDKENNGKGQKKKV